MSLLLLTPPRDGGTTVTSPAYHGVVDVADYTATAGELLESGDSATGWSVSNATQETDTTNKTEGTGARKFTFTMSNALNSRGLFTWTDPLSISGRTLVAFDFRYNLLGPGGPEPFVEVVARASDTTDLNHAAGGNHTEVDIPVLAELTWGTVVLPLEGLTALKSIGLYRKNPIAHGSTARTEFWMDNVRFLDESQLDQAVGSGNAVIVGATYEDDPGQLPLYPHPGKTVLDLKHGRFTGLRNELHLHDYFLDETGTASMGEHIGTIINSAQRGQKVIGTPGATYRMSGDLLIHDLVEVTVDLTGCTLFLDYQSNSAAFWAQNCRNLTWRGGTWLGYGPTTHLGSNLVTVAGTPTTSGSNKLLDAQNEEVRFSWTGDDLPFPYARHMPQQVGMPDDGLGPRNYFKFTLSDSAQVASDCTVYVMDADGNTLPSTILNTSGTELTNTGVLTLTGTPTTYVLQLFPADIHDLLDVRIKKNTATANTITVGDSTSYGRVSYSSTYDVASAHVVDTCTDTTYEDMWIEGFGGDAIQVSDPNTRGVYVRRCTSRGLRRQGMSFNRGQNMYISDCVVGECGRSGIDFEPFAETWFTRYVEVRNVKFYNVQNYCFAMANFAQNFDYVIDGVDVYGVGLGVISGGANRGVFKNMRNWSAPHIGSMDFRFKCFDSHIENIRSVEGIQCNPNAGSFQGVPLTPANNTLSHLDLRYAIGGRKLMLAAGYDIVGPVWIDPTERNNYGSTNTPFGPIDIAGRRFSSVDLGEYARQLPNTFKGTAFSDVWVPGGHSFHDDPTYRVRSLSGGTTKGNNLRGIAATVAASATSHAVTFPTRNVGVLGVASVASSNASAGTLNPSTTYYYRVAARGVNAGPGTYLAQISATTGASHSAVGLNLRGWLDHTNDTLVAGITILRGTASGGPYATRYDIVPKEQFYAVGTNGITCIDLGTSITVPGGETDSYGYATSYAASTGSWTGSVNESGHEPDAEYDVWVTTNWDSGQPWITGKTTAGFTINFPNAAPGDGTGRASWLLVR